MRLFDTLLQLTVTNHCAFPSPMRTFSFLAWREWCKSFADGGSGSFCDEPHKTFCCLAVACTAFSSCSSPNPLLQTFRKEAFCQNGGSEARVETRRYRGRCRCRNVDCLVHYQPGEYRLLQRVFDGTSLYSSSPGCTQISIVGNHKQFEYIQDGPGIWPISMVSMTRTKEERQHSDFLDMPCPVITWSSYSGSEPHPQSSSLLSLVHKESPLPNDKAHNLSLIHIWRCRRIERCRSRWSPYH